MALSRSFLESEDLEKKFACPIDKKEGKCYNELYSFMQHLLFLTKCSL